MRTLRIKLPHDPRSFCRTCKRWRPVGEHERCFWCMPGQRKAKDESEAKAWKDRWYRMRRAEQENRDG